jgi:hypothetical protein
MFSELGFTERAHLQEWIAKNPNILGEDLLIIQKEFDGFNDTNERLDLLALDKDGNLVIIENKLDDTGRDVVWQALKYTSYCSTLTTQQIIKIHQSYLDRNTSGEDAKASIMDFLGIENEDDLILNNEDQRIMFVANNYRKEVTSTVLWLLKHDIQIQCFKATPYSMGEDLFLQVEQIIPVPEIQEFMIDAKEKEREERTKGKAASETDLLLLEFWQQLKSDLSTHNIHYLDNVTPKKSFHYGFWKGKGTFGFVFGRYTNRVELYINDDADKRYIDALLDYQVEIEQRFGEGLVWERLEGKKASRIKFEMPLDAYAQSGSLRDKNWQPKIEWFRNALSRFYESMYPTWEKVLREINQ